jgi:hypothetical protein
MSIFPQPTSVIQQNPKQQHKFHFTAYLKVNLQWHRNQFCAQSESLQEQHKNFLAIGTKDIKEDMRIEVLLTAVITLWKSFTQNLKSSPSSWIDWWAAMTIHWLHQLPKVWIDKYIVIRSKPGKKHYTEFASCISVALPKPMGRLTQCSSTCLHS